METHAPTEKPRLVVLHDGSCPLCRREITLYRAAKGSDALAFRDVSALGPDETACGLPRELAMARFHVADADGRVLSGAKAFVALWAALPRWRWLARLARLPGVTPLLELGYRGFLPLRPLLQRLARRLSRGEEAPDRGI